MRPPELLLLIALDTHAYAYTAPASHTSHLQLQSEHKIYTVFLAQSHSSGAVHIAHKQAFVPQSHSCVTYETDKQSLLTRA